MSLVKDSQSFSDIAQAIEKINHQVIIAGGEITEEIEKQLELTEGLLMNKTEGIVSFLNMADVYFQNLDDKIKELQEKKRTESNKIESFKSHIVHIMSAKEIKKLETPDGLTTITLRKAAMKVNVTDEDKIPSDFITSETKIVNKISLKDIKPHLENGLEVPGAELIKGKQSLIIKTKNIKG